MAIPVIHKITKWPAGAPNEYNETSFGVAVEVEAFWIEEQVKSQDEHDNEFISMAKILSATKLFELGDRVQFAALADSDFAKSFVVKRTLFVENGTQTAQLYKTLLGALR